MVVHTKFLTSFYSSGAFARSFLADFFGVLPDIDWFLRGTDPGLFQEGDHIQLQALLAKLHSVSWVVDRENTSTDFSISVFCFPFFE